MPEEKILTSKVNTKRSERLTAKIPYNLNLLSAFFL